MIKDYPNLHALVKDTVDQHANEPAYKWFKSPSELTGVTWTEFYRDSLRVAKGLMALGVKPDDKVNIVSYTNYEWICCDIGTVFAGGVTVGIYHSNIEKDCEYIINHSEAVVIFVENDLQLGKILKIKKEIPGVKKVVMYKGTPPSGHDGWIITYQDFLKGGDGISDADALARATGRKPQDLACIVYTSGTTGVPKGAMLSHDNMTFTAQSAKACFVFAEQDSQFLFLPLAHVFARICVLFSLNSGVPVTLARSIETVVDDLGVAKPTFFASVPRIYEKVYTKVKAGAEASPVKLKIFTWACGVGYQVSDLKIARKPIPFFLDVQYKIAKKLVFKKLHERLGGNVRFCISGAAPLNPAIARFFHAADILVLEGIGMTENTSFTHVNRFDNYRFGWCGQPGPGVEATIGENKELLIRGRNVMQGYYKMEDETKKTIDADGWLHTGDQGEIDSQGFLKIIGRIKDLIITAGGKNIAPSKIEGLMIQSKYIGQFLVYGDRQKFLVGLATLDKENVTDWAKHHGLPAEDWDALQKHPKVKELIMAEVAERNKELTSVETVKNIAIVPEWTIENGFLTPSMKVKKNVVVEAYKDTILGLYPEDDS